MQMVTMYQIVKEIVHEREKDSLIKSEPMDISAETSKYSKYFKEILKGLKINQKIFITSLSGKNQFEIPGLAKEEVKKLLELYASKEMKKVRKSHFTDLSFHELKEIVESAKLILCYKLEGKELLFELNQLNLLTQFPLKEAVAEFEDEALQELISDTKKILSNNLNQVLNQSDRGALIRYYNYEIKRVHKNLKSLVVMIDDLRSAELSEVTEEAYNQAEAGLKDHRIEIHKDILHEILLSPTENLKDFRKMTGLQDDKKILSELNELQQNKSGTKHFKLCDDNLNFGSLQVSKIEDLINEAIETFKGNS